MTRDNALIFILREYDRACLFHPPIEKIHEGFGIITEEYFEFVEAVRGNTPAFTLREVAHLGAMCLRFLTDLTPPNYEAPND